MGSSPSRMSTSMAPLTNVSLNSASRSPDKNASSEETERRQRSVFPACDVGAGRGGARHPIGGLGKDALLDGEMANGDGLARSGRRDGGVRVAAEAVRQVRAIFEIAGVIGIVGLGEKLLEEADGVVEIVGVARADLDVNLADELGSERLPVALKDVAQVVVLAPIGGDLMVNHAGKRIPDGLGVAIVTDGAVDGLPDIVLVGGAAMSAEHELAAVFAVHGGDDGVIRRAGRGASNAGPRAFGPQGVLVIIKVDDLVGAEVHRVWAHAPGAVEKIGIEDLHAQRFPAARGAAIKTARPALPDAAELLLDRRDQLLRDGIAVGADVCGIHRVGIVVVGIGMLGFKGDYPGAGCAGPARRYRD